MARRRVKHVQVGRCAVDIYRGEDEYIVHTTVMGRRDSGYFTTEKRDARSTAAHQVRWLRRTKPICKVGVLNGRRR